MKLRDSKGLRMSIPASAAAILDEAKAKIEAAVAPAEVTPVTPAVTQVHVDQVETPNGATVKIEASAQPAVTASSNTSIMTQLKTLVMKLVGLLILPLTTPVKWFRSGWAAFQHHRPWAAFALKAAILLCAAGALAAMAAAPQTQALRLHGELENAGFFSRLGFDMDNEKATLIQTSGFGGARKIEARLLIDGKGREYVPTAAGGWVRK